MIALHEVSSSFTDAEKDACLPLVSEMKELIYLYSTEGTIGLEDIISEGLFKPSKHKHVQKAVDFFMNSCPSPWDFSNMFRDDSCKGIKMLENIIVIESLNMLHDWKTCNTAQFELKLNSMLGEKYLLTNCPLNDFNSAVSETEEADLRDILSVFDIQDIETAWRHSQESRRIWEALTDKRTSALGRHRRNYIPLSEIEDIQRKITKQIELFKSQGRSSLAGSLFRKQDKNPHGLRRLK